jgi:cytidylate kinase
MEIKKTRKRSIEQIVEEQVQRWGMLHAVEMKEEERVSLITVSREPGSGGSIIAKRIAELLELDLFHGEVIQEMAESAQISGMLMESLDEKGISFVADWISTLVNEKHLWPDQYLQHLMKVINTIGKHGRAVIVGRGANFILPSEGTFRIRVLAALDIRVKNVARDYGIPFEEAKRRVLQTESERRAFVRKYFHEDIASPVNYDLIINSGILSIDAAVNAIRGALGR